MKDPSTENREACRIHRVFVPLGTGGERAGEDDRHIVRLDGATPETIDGGRVQDLVERLEGLGQFYGDLISVEIGTHGDLGHGATACFRSTDPASANLPASLAAHSSGIVCLGQNGPTTGQSAAHRAKAA